MGYTPNGPSFSKGEIKLESHIEMKSGNSYLMCFYIGIVHKNFKLIIYQNFNNQMGYPGDKN